MNKDLFEDAKPIFGDFIYGNNHSTKRFNFKKECDNFKNNPVSDLLVKIRGEESLFRDEIYRHQEAYDCFFLTLTRLLKHISISIRFHESASYKRKYRQKMSDYERKLSKEYNKSVRFSELDYFSFLLYTRILLDRTAAISRFFIDGKDKPSFTSFADHKKFFKKLKTPYGQHEMYALKIKQETDWFDLPLKFTRDKFIVHNGPKHMQYFGLKGNTPYNDLCLVYFVPDNKEGDLSKVKVIQVSAITLAHDTLDFLKWFSEYGKKAIQSKSKIK